MNRIASVLVAAWLALLVTPAAKANDADYLTYAEFIAAVDAGSVKSVSVDRFSAITGTRTVDGQEKRFRTYADTGSANDVLLIRLLKDKNVELSITNKDENRLPLVTGLVGLVMLIVPILTLFFVFRISWRVGRVRKEVAALNQYWAEDAHDAEFR